jgi:hypothetical protein
VKGEDGVEGGGDDRRSGGDGASVTICISIACWQKVGSEVEQKLKLNRHFVDITPSPEKGQKKTISYFLIVFSRPLIRGGYTR